MSEFEIEKGVPIPPRILGPSSRRGVTKYPWPSMDVGDSIFLATNGQKSEQKRFINNAHHWGQVSGIGRLFKSRKVTEDGREGVRVWRVA